MQAARAALVSEEEFLALPESMNRVELLDGEVIVAPALTYWHQETLRRIVLALGVWARTYEGPITIGQSPVDIRFRPGRILQPDAFVHLARIPRDHKGPIDRVPEICIEVLSLDRVYDRVTKRLVYAEAGVREYWVVDPAEVVEAWRGDGLAHAEHLRDRLTSPLLPVFELDLRALFAE